LVLDGLAMDFLTVRGHIQKWQLAIKLLAELDKAIGHFMDLPR
jgi:hypothetical protein